MLKPPILRLLLAVLLVFLSGCVGAGTPTAGAANPAHPILQNTNAPSRPAPAFSPTATPSTGTGPGWTLKDLPDTGQVKDYTAAFGEDSDYPGNPPAYTDNGDGTVTDLVTGLFWQQQDGSEMPHANANRYCQELTLAGQSDWRLPTTLELYSLVDLDHNPAINLSFFASSSSAEYWWAAEEMAGDPGKAWAVNAGGGTGAHPKNETLSAGGSKRFQVRCVRSTSANPAAHFIDLKDATVKDNYTGLVWQQAEGTPALNWETALNYCENLTLAGLSDWRLPNLKELHSISDILRVRPALDRTFFPEAQAARYWTSTTQFGHAAAAWFVDFTSGLTSYYNKVSALAVRCVRE